MRRIALFGIIIGVALTIGVIALAVLLLVDDESPIVEDAVAPTVAVSPATGLASPGAATAGGRASPQGGVCPPSHPIKGNATIAGQRLYYRPGEPGYLQTAPEVCFATDADAALAGFIPAPR